MADNIAEIAQRHGFSVDAARAVADALRHGGGRMAQFNHPELGGMGQWSAGGMLMIGDMFNHALKSRVDALCRDLVAMPAPAQSDEQRPEQTEHWWPDGFWHRRQRPARRTTCATPASPITIAWR